MTHRRPRRIEFWIIIGIILAINAGVFLYAWNKAQSTADIACNASALVSQQVQDIYRRNINETYPELYRNGQITGDGLATLTENATKAIHRLDEAERQCVEAVGELDTFD